MRSESAGLNTSSSSPWASREIRKHSAFRLVVGPDEVRELDPGSSLRRPQHDDLRPRVRDADDRVQELALHQRAALDLETLGA